MPQYHTIMGKSASFTKSKKAVDNAKSVQSTVKALQSAKAFADKAKRKAVTIGDTFVNVGNKIAKIPAGTSVSVALKAINDLTKKGTK